MNHSNLSFTCTETTLPFSITGSRKNSFNDREGKDEQLFYRYDSNSAGYILLQILQTNHNHNQAIFYHCKLIGFLLAALEATGLT